MSARGGWRPIKTAPRDARTIIVWCDFCDMANTAYWGDDALDPRPAAWYWTWWAPGDGPTDCFPTHWMPLPGRPS